MLAALAASMLMPASPRRGRRSRPRRAAGPPGRLPEAARACPLRHHPPDAHAREARDSDDRQGRRRRRPSVRPPQGQAAGGRGHRRASHQARQRADRGGQPQVAGSATAEDGDVRYLTSPRASYRRWSAPKTVNDDGPERPGVRRPGHRAGRRAGGRARGVGGPPPVTRGAVRVPQLREPPRRHVLGAEAGRPRRLVQEPAGVGHLLDLRPRVQRRLQRPVRRPLAPVRQLDRPAPPDRQLRGRGQRLRQPGAAEPLDQRDGLASRTSPASGAGADPATSGTPASRTGSRPATARPAASSRSPAGGRPPAGSRPRPERSVACGEDSLWAGSDLGRTADDGQDA